VKDAHVVRKAILNGIDCGTKMALADLELLADNPSGDGWSGFFSEEYCQADFEKTYFSPVREAPASYKLFYDAAYRTYATVFDLGWRKLLKFGKVGK
jgi:hypothetical protein